MDLVRFSTIDLSSYLNCVGDCLFVNQSDPLRLARVVRSVNDADLRGEIKRSFCDKLLIVLGTSDGR